MLAGIANYFSLNVTLLRILYIVFFITNMLLATLIYIIAAIILPCETSQHPRRRVQAKKVKATDWSKF